MWDQRLGHSNSHSLKSILGSLSISFDNFEIFNYCNSCLCNKSHRLPFSNNTLHSVHPLQLLYSDVWGPSPVTSVDAKLYYVLFVDHYTRYSWLYTVQQQNEVTQIFKDFQSLVE